MTRTLSPPVPRRPRAAPYACHRRAGSRTAGGDAGSVAAEVAIAVPVLVALLLFAGVLVARGVQARLRLDNAAHQAARAASLARTPTAARTAAQQTALADLSDAGVDCAQPTVSVDVSDFGPGGTVTVTVSCRLNLADAAKLLAITGDHTVTATATSPVDPFRATNATAVAVAPTAGDPGEGRAPVGHGDA